MALRAQALRHLTPRMGESWLSDTGSGHRLPWQPTKLALTVDATL